MSLIFAFLLYLGGLFAATDAPPKILAKRQMESWPANFTLEEKPLIVAEVETKFFGSVREYDLYAKGKRLLAKAKHSICRACTLFTIESPEDEYLGLIEEFPSYFNIYDDQDELIATSCTNYWETKILLLDPEGDVIGSLTRPVLREHDGWSLSLNNPADWSLNKAIWLLLPAIHTDRPYWQKFPFYHSQNPKPAQ